MQTLGYSCILGILSVMVSPTNLITAYIVTSVLFFSMTILARANLVRTQLITLTSPD